MAKVEWRIKQNAKTVEGIQILVMDQWVSKYYFCCIIK